MRHPNHRRVKLHLSYTTPEAARCLGVHNHTVRLWLKAGLVAIDNRRPVLILGRDLIAFLRQRKARTQCSCKPGEIYCLRCHVARRPAGDVVRYESIRGDLGRLVGRCSACGGPLYRGVSRLKLEQVRGNLAVTMPGAVRDISDTAPRLVIAHLKRGA